MELFLGKTIASERDLMHKSSPADSEVERTLWQGDLWELRVAPI